LLCGEAQRTREEVQRNHCGGNFCEAREPGIVAGARSSRRCHDAEKACQLGTPRQHWRMLPSHLCRLILFALLSFIPIMSQAADKRAITEKDLFDFVWIGDPQISPDGSRVAFVRVS